jgi:uncharacterized protein YegP (UPF0339 family)
MHFKVYRSFWRREWRWKLIAANGETLAVSSEGYRNKGDCRNAIEAIQREASKAVIREADA